MLDLHGWGDLQPTLRQMTKDNQWDKLGEPITDEMLETLVVLDSNLDGDSLAEQMAILRET